MQPLSSVGKAASRAESAGEVGENKVNVVACWFFVLFGGCITNCCNCGYLHLKVIIYDSRCFYACLLCKYVSKCFSVALHI